MGVWILQTPLYLSFGDSRGRSLLQSPSPRHGAEHGYSIGKKPKERPVGDDEERSVVLDKKKGCAMCDYGCDDNYGG